MSALMDSRLDAERLADAVAHDALPPHPHHLMLLSLKEALRQAERCDETADYSVEMEAIHDLICGADKRERVVWSEAVRESAREANRRQAREA